MPITLTLSIPGDLTVEQHEGHRVVTLNGKAAASVRALAGLPNSTDPAIDFVLLTPEVAAILFPKQAE